MVQAVHNDVLAIVTASLSISGQLINDGLVGSGLFLEK